MGEGVTGARIETRRTWRDFVRAALGNVVLVDVGVDCDGDGDGDGDGDFKRGAVFSNDHEQTWHKLELYSGSLCSRGP